MRSNQNEKGDKAAKKEDNLGGKGGPVKTKSSTEAEKKLNEKRVEQNDMTMVTETTGNIALRTIPVYIKNGNRKLQVNALLDDASTKTYINVDVAAELGLQGCLRKVM